MKLWVKFLIVTILIGIPAFILGPVLWSPSPDIKPTPGQMPFFIFLALVESLFFGFGIAFIIFARPLMKKASQSKGITTAAFIAISWLLVSWWPHDNMHIHNGMDAQGLLYIDYGFHFTLIIAALVLSYYFISLMKIKAR